MTMSPDSIRAVTARTVRAANAAGVARGWPDQYTWIANSTAIITDASPWGTAAGGAHAALIGHP